MLEFNSLSLSLSLFDITSLSMFNRSTRNKHGPNSETLEDDARVLKIFRECLRFIYPRVDDKNVYIINGEHIPKAIQSFVEKHRGWC